MANKFEITKDIMKDANTYMSIALKDVIAMGKARECVRKVSKIRPIGEDEAESANEYGVAPIYCEDTAAKARVMMTCLMAYYLKVWGEDTPIMCDIHDYDDWGGAHVLNQIERFKSGEYREKAFDILSDYREMEKYLNAAIYAVLRELNDPAKRIIEAIGAMGSVDWMKETIGKIEEVEKGIKEEQERQERIINGEEAGDGDEDAGEQHK